MLRRLLHKDLYQLFTKKKKTMKKTNVINY